MKMNGQMLRHARANIVCSNGNVAPCWMPNFDGKKMRRAYRDMMRIRRESPTLLQQVGDTADAVVSVSRLTFAWFRYKFAFLLTWLKLRKLLSA